MTPEKKAYYDAVLFGKNPPVPPKPAKVVAEGGRIVREVEVQVSPADYNFPGAGRGGFVRIDMEEAQRQWEEREAAKRLEERRKRELDPFGYGHWNKD